MKLSEAIRLGAMQGPQLFCELTDWVETLEAKERPTASEVEELVTS